MGGAVWKVLGATLLAWWLIWWDPTSNIVAMQNMLAEGPKDL